MLNNYTEQIFQYNGSPISFQKGDSVMVNATEMAKPFKNQQRIGCEINLQKIL